MEFINDLKLILKYLRPYRKRVLFLTILSTIAAAFASAIPYIYGHLFDVAIKHDSKEGSLIIFLLFLWLFFTLINNYIERFLSREGDYLATKASNDFLLKASTRLMKLSVSFHKKQKGGKIMSRFYQASSQIDSVISQIGFDVLPVVISLLISLIVIAFIEPILSALLALILIVFSAITILKTKPVIKAQERIQKDYDKTYSGIHESVTNSLLAKIFCNEEVERDKIKKSLKNIVYSRKNIMAFWTNIDKWQQTIFSLGFVMLFSIGLYFVKANQITTGNFITFIGYVFIVFNPLRMLASDYRWIKRSAVSIKKAEKIFSEKPEPYHKKGKETKEIKGKVEFKNISFAYDKNPVLEDVSFVANAGETVALVGESGVGKTTIIDLISRYYSPQKGEILVDETNIKKLNIVFLRSLIAIVPQETTMFNNTIKYNISYAKKSATDEEIMAVAKAANADEFIERFPKKYKQVVGERGIKLSTGQKQRVAIARALLRDPKILILDEATSSLDSISENFVQEALSRLIKNRTTFIIAHRLSTITHADKIIVLEKGRIAEIGTHEELLKKGGVYQKLYTAQKF